ncbi:hypothetical protein FKP32DRAFT_1602658 [Trametes sanguinea]|nr:hypothetical protein FKP32DRAFT_1602658 [Trametes sanguinea]
MRAGSLASSLDSPACAISHALLFASRSCSGGGADVARASLFIIVTRRFRERGVVSHARGNLGFASWEEGCGALWAAGSEQWAASSGQAAGRQDRAPTTVPATSGAISQKRAAHSALDDDEVGEDEAPKRLKRVSDTDEASGGDEENDENEHSDGSEQNEEDDGSDEHEEEEDDDASDDENGDVERFLEDFARATIRQGLWALTDTVPDLPENCGQAGVREMYMRCLEVGTMLSDARVRTGNLTLAHLNARMAEGVASGNPVSSAEASQYARIVHNSIFQPTALRDLEGMLAECRAVAGMSFTSSIVAITVSPQKHPAEHEASRPHTEFEVHY